MTRFYAGEYDEIPDGAVRHALRGLRADILTIASALFGQKDLDQEGLLQRVARIDRQLRWLIGGVGLLVGKAVAELFI